MRILLLALLLCLSSCRLFDQNHDGALLLACIGDSNTYEAFGPYSWCFYTKQKAVAAGFTNMQTINPSMFGATAISTGAFWRDEPLDIEYRVQLAIHASPKPDVAIVAVGTNDIAQHLDPEAIAQRLAAIHAELTGAGIDCLIATIPPIVLPGVTNKPWAPTDIAVVNNRLYELLPAKDIVRFDQIPDSDFDAGPPGDRITVRDGGHINTTGQLRRADLALGALLNTDP